MYGWFAYRHAHHFCGGQMRVLGPLELESLRAVSLYVGTGN